MIPRAPAHLLLSAALLALVLGAFVAGWWMGRTSRLDLEIENRLARLEEGLGEVKARAPGPGASLAGRAAFPGKVHSIDIGDSPVAGAADAPVTIVGFSDFECPYCASADPTLKRILAEYRGKVRFVFKHNPLPFHKSALLAHRAAVAAQRQGKFWEMHDLLFASQDELDRESLLARARGLGLDLRSFEELLSSPVTTQVVSADMAQAGSLGIEGTPAFFVNGRFLPGAQPFEVFQELIEEELHPDG